MAILFIFVINFLWELHGMGTDECDFGVYSFFGDFYCNEMLVDTDGTFYMDISNSDDFTLNITSIDVRLRYHSSPTFTVEKPQLPLLVKAGDRFIISGRYDTLEAVRDGEEYVIVIDVNSKRVFSRPMKGNDASNSKRVLRGQFGIRDKHPEIECKENEPTSPLFIFLFAVARFLADAIYKAFSVIR